MIIMGLILRAQYSSIKLEKNEMHECHLFCTKQSAAVPTSLPIVVPA